MFGAHHDLERRKGCRKQQQRAERTGSLLLFCRDDSSSLGFKTHRKPLAWLRAIGYNAVERTAR